MCGSTCRSAAGDVRHLCPGWRTSPVMIEPIIGKDGAHPRRGWKLRSFQNNGTFDRVTGKVNAAGSVVTAPWAFANSSIEADNAPSNVSTERNSVTYNLILVPQTFESHLFFTASVLLDGINLQEFYANIDFSEIEGNGNVNEMKPGYQYNVTVNVNKTGLSVGKCEITPWTELSGSIEATM